jgi:hypothetical protein
MNLNDLQISIKEIDSLVRQKYPWDDAKGIGPILDGIINADKYLNAKYKILWILKEPYDEIDENGSPCGGGWDLKEIMNEKKSINEFGSERKTFQPMIYTSYGILNNFCLWDKIPDIETADVFNTLKSISYINIKKMPGFSNSPKSIISSAYNENKDILIKQIQVGKPDIIIGGGTLKWFSSDLGFVRNNWIIRESGSFPYYIRGNQLFIGAYHPSSVPRLTDEKTYCNDLIITVKSFMDMLKQ